jgi:hypothetical protein
MFRSICTFGILPRPCGHLVFSGDLALTNLSTRLSHREPFRGSSVSLHIYL